MKICIICVNKNDHAPKRIFEEGKRMGHEMHLTRWTDIILSVNENSVFIGDKHRSLEEFDAIIPRSPNFTNQKRVHKKLGTLLRLIIQFAQKNNIVVLNSNFFNNYQSLDKLAQQFFLFQNNLPGIPTQYFSNLNALGNHTKINYPIVIKTTQGSLGSGVFMANNKHALEKFTQESNESGKQFLFQKYCKIECDYRVLVINQKSIGVMQRSPQTEEWRTNVALGGKTFRVEDEKTEKIKRLAEKTAKKMLLDYVGVDILKDGNTYRVIETNSLAQFRGFEQVFPEVNVAREIIRLIELRVDKKQSK